MNNSQNTISFALMVAIAISLSVSTGCKLGALPKLPAVSLPKLPDMAKWKKDNFRLSRSKSDSVAPPSRTFDPKPSHFAAMDSERSSASNQMASNGSRPIREPYDVGEETPTTNDSFGFPKDSNALMGNGNFSEPAANDFRQAMNDTREKANDFAASTQQAASQTIDRTKDFVANAQNNFSAGGGDFNPSGGDFAPRNNNQQFLNQSAEVARNVTQNQPAQNQSRWQNNDFNPSNGNVQNPVSIANQMAGDFKASTQKAVDNVKQGVADFGQKAVDKANDGFQAAQQSASNFANNARDSIDSTNQKIGNVAGQFERSWQDSVDQAKQAANSIRNSNAFSGAGSQTPSNMQGGIQGGQSQMQPDQSIANNDRQLQPVRQNQRAIEVTPEVEYGNQQQPANPNGQYASTGGNGAFQTPANNLNQRQPANSGQAFTPNPQQSNSSNAGSRYPSTDYNPYIYGDNEKVSQVTPINEPATSAPPQARTSSLPSELLRGNSNYAPGSVKQLSPIK